MTPRSPIGREQAGPPAGHPDGVLGGCPFSEFGPSSPAPAPGSATDHGGTRPAASAVPVPAGHRSSSSEPTHLSALLAVDLAVSCCPSHGRFRSCPRPPRFCRAGTARAGWRAPGQGARRTGPEALTFLEPRPIEEPRGLGLPGAARRPRLFSPFRACLAWAGVTGDSCSFPSALTCLLFGKLAHGLGTASTA
jgi:hypothetical protein